MAQNRLRRARLYAKQGGNCLYCGRLTGWAGPKNLQPIVEHFLPRCQGNIGKRLNLVLACAWCDKAKGMIPGPEFMALLLAETEARPFSKAMQDIKRRAKALNVELHSGHKPNVTGYRA